MFLQGSLQMGSAGPGARCQATTSRRTEVRDKAPNMGPSAENSILITLIGSGKCPGGVLES